MTRYHHNPSRHESQLVESLKNQGVLSCDIQAVRDLEAVVKNAEKLSNHIMRVRDIALDEKEKLQIELRGKDA